MASDAQSVKQAEFLQGFLANEQQVRINTGKWACALVFVLMPLGVIVDYFVYHELLWEFLRLRLLCSLLILGVWLLHYTPLARKHYPVVGLPIVLLPALFMTWMIYRAGAPEGPYHNDARGAAGPYYAALNLIMLAVSAVGHWSLLETGLAVGSVIGMYLLACLARGYGNQNFSMLFNNLYFLALTGVIVACGNYLFNRLRFREFALRYELDKNRKALEESNRKLLELDQVKSRFFANISHELRTPLTLLLAPLEAMLHRVPAEPETGDLLHTMHANGMRLLKLINDLLDLVRLESGRLEIKREPLDLAEFVKGLASAARQVAVDKRLRLETFVAPELGTVLADRDRLEKIVLNLIFNALKFTPAGGRVELRAEKQGPELVLIVSDTGMGIAEKNLPFVFDRFWQADGSSKRKYQGAGIGLALVKELVEAQGGKVGVQSREGQGATFTVRLPYQAGGGPPKPKPEETADSPPALQTGAGTVSSNEWLADLYRRAELFPALTPLQPSLRPVETSGDGKRPVVLVADDEPDMLRFLNRQLSSKYQVLEAVDGQQAIEKASQFLPDLILLDMMMPEKDGLQACRELRERASTQAIPVVLLTARADEDTKLAALSAGASDFLTKPFSTTELHVRIRNLVQSHQYQAKLARQNQLLETTIDQLKQTETQLVQSEKLASLGRMSAGIIHEINNPLNFATTGLFTLRKRTQALAPAFQQECQGILTDVEEGLKRVKNIVSDLRMFTHPDTESREEVQAAEVVAAALRFLSNEWKDKVQIERKLPEGQTILANKNTLINVLVNLLQNSLDAFPNKTFTGERPTIWIEGRLEPGKSILLVRDNGPGIQPQHLDKVFDPFFTTKDVGQGMGLGLTICYRIVQDCQGRIAVRTEPGQFCEFALEFPADP
jgi:signal transduction histidine kinase